MDLDPHDMAARLLVSLEGGLPVPDDVRVWAASGLRDYLSAGGSRRLCSCLRLAAPGQRRPGTLKRRAHARELLRWLIEDLRGGTAASTWSCCQKLSELIDRFERRHWPRVKEADTCPRDFSVQQTVLWAFFLNCHGNPPRTARGLYDFLGAEGK
jgi:hypothetical protein